MNCQAGKQNSQEIQICKFVLKMETALRGHVFICAIFINHSIILNYFLTIVFFFSHSDGHGFTRERKTRLLQWEEERKEPQSAPSSRQMTTAEFAVVQYALFFTAK